MKTWISGDYHLGHFNIIKYANRPFKTLEKMNEAIIRNHNARVKLEDNFIHNGDFCFRNTPGGKNGEGSIIKAFYYIKQLNGNKTFMRGNHDSNNSLKTNIHRVILEYANVKICIVHNPTHASRYYPINLVAHIHNAWKIKRFGKNSLLYNVGVDVHNYMPINLEEIMVDIKRWKKSGRK